MGVMEATSRKDNKMQIKTTDYMVQFDPATHGPGSFYPPKGVKGGPMGNAVGKGVVAVYMVPEGQEEAFEAAVKASSSMLSFQKLESKK